MFDTKVLDIEGVMGRLENDRELLLELGAIFFQEAPGLISAISSAIDSQQSKALQTGAHTLKGAAGNVGAIKVQATSFTLEQLGRSGSCQGAEELFETLKQQVDEFKIHFDQYCRESK